MAPLLRPVDVALLTVLRLHQVRYGVDLLPYDLAWNLAGALLLAVGALLLVRVRRRGPDPVP